MRTWRTWAASRPISTINSRRHMTMGRSRMPKSTRRSWTACSSQRRLTMSGRYVSFFYFHTCSPIPFAPRGERYLLQLDIWGGFLETNDLCVMIIYEGRRRSTGNMQNRLTYPAKTQRLISEILVQPTILCITLVNRKCLKYGIDL